MASGEEIFSVMQACIILSWYFYQEGRWVEVWIFASFQTRVAIPLRLNYPGTFSTHGNSSPGAYLAPPKDRRDLEARRRTWWMTIMFDRIASVGGWIHAVDERDLGTELPLRLSDFESDVRLFAFLKRFALIFFTRHLCQVIRRTSLPKLSLYDTILSTLIRSCCYSKLLCYSVELQTPTFAARSVLRLHLARTRTLSF